tara:strand:+ start:1666 stop:2070 length:405 start_codon:yes stop_codon:yes gene_type:complete
MALADAYIPIKTLHISTALLSGGVFFLRGILALYGSRLSENLILKRLSYVDDTILLVAGVLLMRITQQYPFAQAWLGLKLALILVYIVLGVHALRKARTAVSRRLFFFAALGLYLTVILLARHHLSFNAVLHPI